jgi:hypothetical protein
VAIPTLKLRLCSRIAIRFDAITTDSKVYPNLDPPAISVAQLPGSIYPTEIRNPGPRKPRRRRQQKGDRETATEEYSSGSEGSCNPGSTEALEVVSVYMGLRGRNRDGINLSMPHLVNCS